MIKPDKTYYTFRNEHYGELLAVDPGFGAWATTIIQAIWKVGRRNVNPNPSAVAYSIVFQLYKDAANFFQLLQAPAENYKLQVPSGSMCYFYNPIFGFASAIFVLWAAQVRSFVDGQLVALVATANYDMSGVWTVIRLGRYGGALRTSTHDICGLRVWNIPSMPGGWENALRRLVMNPWYRTTHFGAAPTYLKLEYLLNSDIPAASLVIPNSANPGVADLPIINSAGAPIQWQNARQEFMTR